MPRKKKGEEAGPGLSRRDFFRSGTAGALTTGILGQGKALGESGATTEILGPGTVAIRSPHRTASPLPTHGCAGCPMCESSGIETLCGPPNSFLPKHVRVSAFAERRKSSHHLQFTE